MFARISMSIRRPSKSPLLRGSGPGGRRTSFAVRMPLHPLALQLGRAVGPMVFSGLASTVAPGQPLNPDVAQHPWTVLDVGELPPAPPSTIVDVRSGQARMVRAGALSEERVRAVLPTLHVTP